MYFYYKFGIRLIFAYHVVRYIVCAKILLAHLAKNRAPLSYSDAPKLSIRIDFFAIIT